MGNKLHQIGASFYRHPWRVIAAWIVILSMLGGIAATQYKQPTSAITIPGVAGANAMDRMNELFPEAGRGTARVVVKAPEGKTINDYRTDIDSFVANVKKVDGVKTAVSPFVNTRSMSSDKRTAIIQLQLAESTGSVPTSTTTAVEDEVKTLVSHGFQAEMGGDIIQKAPSQILGIGEVIGLLIAIVVLSAAYKSLRLAGLSVAIAIMTVAVAMAGLFGLSKVVTISATTPVLSVMLGLAVGIDYSLFIVNKYQRLIRDNVDPEDAAARANATAGNAVIFAATTVVIALAALSVVNIPFMTTMGLAGAATIALAAVVAVTLVPALLSLVARRIAKSPRASARATHKSRHKLAYAWMNIVTRRPWLILGTSVLVVALIAWPIRNIQLGLPLDEFAAKTSTERKAYDMVAEEFGKGYNSPLAVVVENVPAVTDAEQQQVRDGLMAQYNAKVTEETAKAQAEMQQQAAMITTPDEYIAFQQKVAEMTAQAEQQKAAALAQINAGAPELAKRLHLQKIADAIKKKDNVHDAVVALAKDDGSAGVIQVIPNSAPFDSETTTLINDLRDESFQKSLSSYDGATYGVTGSTAMQNDINKKLAEALPIYLTVVVGLSLLILVVAFRSILVPIKATLGFILSVLAMFGALVAVFQWGWFGVAEAPGPIISFIPIIATGILFGLSMDYEFFLVSSMHEAHADGMKARKAVVEGFSHSARVVVTAAVIMIAVFGGFVFNHDSTVQAIGFGLAIGIMVDAFIVRLTIVPAVMTLLGESAWWLPKWLDKILPHVSIEGEE